MVTPAVPALPGTTAPPNEQGEDASFAQRVQDLVDAGDGGLSEGADDVELLLVNRDENASVFLTIATMGPEYGEVQCWMSQAEGDGR